MFDGVETLVIKSATREDPEGRVDEFMGWRRQGVEVVLWVTSLRRYKKVGSQGGTEVKERIGRTLGTEGFCDK